jgi:hypothetical protein
LLQQSFMGLLERNAGCVFRLGLWVAHEEKWGEEWKKLAGQWLHFHCGRDG